MTLGQASILVTIGLVAGPLVGTVATGQAMFTTGILAAPLPSLVVYGFLRDYEDWALGHLLDHLRDDNPIEADLDAALRPPIPIPDHTVDEGDYFVPDCPALPPTRETAPPRA